MLTITVWIVKYNSVNICFFISNRMMNWKCRVCRKIHGSQVHLLRHYRVEHRHGSKISALPCMCPECPWTFYTFSAFKTHMCRYHVIDSNQVRHTFHLNVLCVDLNNPFLNTHCIVTSVHLMSVVCPYKNCSYSTNVYSSFKTHKSSVKGKGHGKRKCFKRKQRYVTKFLICSGLHNVVIIVLNLNFFPFFK